MNPILTLCMLDVEQHDVAERVMSELPNLSLDTKHFIIARGYDLYNQMAESGDYISFLAALDTTVRCIAEEFGLAQFDVMYRMYVMSNQIFGSAEKSHQCLDYILRCSNDPQ